MTAQPGIAEKTAGPSIAGPGAAPRIADGTLRRLYLPTVVVAGLAAWLSWLGWETLARYGPLLAEFQPGAPDQPLAAGLPAGTVTE